MKNYKLYYLPTTRARKFMVAKFSAVDNEHALKISRPIVGNTGQILNIFNVTDGGFKSIIKNGVLK